MQFAAIGGNTIHFADTGPRDAQTVVFSNSLGTDFRVWDKVLSAFESSYRVIRYDKRGHGLSDATPAPYRMEDHVNDLAGLLDHLRVTNAVIVGLSVGGMIAQSLHAARPDLVRAIVLMDTAHKIGTEPLWNDRIAAVEGKGIASISPMILERWFSRSFRETQKPEFALWRNMLERTTVAGYSGTCAALRDADNTENAKRINVPVLLMVGSNDGSTPPDLVRSTHELIANSRFRVIDGPGHLPCVEAPDETARLILDFFRENEIV
ncbi:MAG: 3-oxoadipate enol-lactonase [Nitratireductor sp.]